MLNANEKTTRAPASSLPPSFVIGAGLSNHAHKADQAPPIWYKNSLQLQKLLQGAWEEVSADFVEKLRAAFQANDQATIKKLLEESAALGEQMTEALGNSPDAVLSSLVTKANAFWTAKAVSAGVEKAKGIAARYRESMAQVQAQQIKNFAASYPERILHPEISKQLAYLQEVESPDALQITTINEQLDAALASSEEYWAGISDVKAARAWHGAGVKVARQNKIKTGQIAGPLDDDTCPVCFILVGLEVDFASLLDKFDADGEIEDPDEYAAAWSFPRIGDVANMSREELAKKFVEEGWSVPLHPHCRHSLAWLYMDDDTEISQEE